MMQRDHHDWASEPYVDESVRRQQAEDPSRADRFQLMCDLFPFSADATVTILDVGAGYGPVSLYILDRFPHATCVGQDGSVPMLNRARTLMAKYGKRFTAHQSDLFDKSWLPTGLGPFDAAVSSACLHNLRDFTRISEIYRDVRVHLRPGGIFLNVDLVNAPSADLWQRYGGIAAARRGRAGIPAPSVEAMAPQARRSPGAGPFPADLDQHLAALTAAGFRDIDCFWKDLSRALFGGYA